MAAPLVTLMNQIRQLSGVIDVAIYDKQYPFEKWLVVATVNSDTGIHVNGGLGYGCLYIDLMRKKLVCQQCAGPATEIALAATIATLETMAAP